MHRSEVFSGRRAIRVALAGPYPKPNSMTGTYGRILGHMISSPVFQPEVEFIPLHLTLPSDGGRARRMCVDAIRFARCLKQKPDILHLVMQKYQALYREFPILEVTRRAGIKTVVDIRAGTLQAMLARSGFRLQNGMMRRILKTGNAISVECVKDVGYLKQYHGLEGLYIPNVVLQEDYRRVIPARLPQVRGEPLRIIYSGRYSRDKGLGTILQSLHLLSKDGIRVELHLSGQSDDAAMRDMVLAYVRSPPQGTKVVDHGWDVPDLLGLLASSHVFALPTQWWGEGHPNAVTEAMTAGLAMVLSDWIHREDIVPEGGALIVPPNDAAALAGAFRRFAEEPALLASAGKVNRTHVGERFLDTVNYSVLLDAYRRLSGGDQAAAGSPA